MVVLLWMLLVGFGVVFILWCSNNITGETVCWFVFLLGCLFCFCCLFFFLEIRNANSNFIGDFLFFVFVFYNGRLLLKLRHILIFNILDLLFLFTITCKDGINSSVKFLRFYLNLTIGLHIRRP